MERAPSLVFVSRRVPWRKHCSSSTQSRWLCPCPCCGASPPWCSWARPPAYWTWGPAAAWPSACSVRSGPTVSTAPEPGPWSPLHPARPCPACSPAHCRARGQPHPHPTSQPSPGLPVPSLAQTGPGMPTRAHGPVSQGIAQAPSAKGLWRGCPPGGGGPSRWRQPQHWGPGARA